MAHNADSVKGVLMRWMVSPLQGMTFGDWLAVLRDNRWEVHPCYWLRASLTTATALTNSIQARIEERRYGERLSTTQIQAPVFVLGHYRSGTTHLHNLLATDRRLVYPNNYQANFPHTFLTTEQLGSKLGSRLIPRQRPHDGVELHLGAPAEDELALCVQTGLSPHMAWHFPAHASRYERYVTLREASDTERECWKAALRRLLGKLTLKHEGGTVVLKSPCHTGRVKLILEAFPDARFVHIHRDPYRVFQSTRHMERKVAPLFQFQQHDHAQQARLDQWILRRYQLMYEAFLGDQPRIPSRQFIEIAYHDLVNDPMHTLARIYMHLNLPDFEVARPDVRQYLERVADYRTNTYNELDQAVRRRVAHAWRRTFDAWGYRR